MGTQKPTRRDFLAQAATAGALAGCATAQNPGTTSSSTGPAPTRRTLGVNDKVRCGIIGAGGRGSSLLQETLRRDDVLVVAVCDAYDLWRDRAVNWCKEHYPSVGGYHSYQEMLAAENLDAVIIATPDHIHADAAIAALDQRLDVYCEKPMTLTLEDAVAMRQRAADIGAIVQVGTQLRSTDIYQRGRDLYESGTIGTLAEVQVNRHSGDGMVSYNAPPTEANESNVHWDEFLHGTKHYRFDPRRFFQWRFFEEYSNGVTGDLMMHHLDAFHFITGCGMPERAMSIGGIYHYDDGRTVPDTVSTVLSYPEGFQFNYTTTLVNGHYGTVERYLGSDGVLEFTGMGVLKVIKRDFENVFESRGPDTRSHIANFFECVRSRETPAAPIEAGFQGATAGFLAVQSERSGEAMHWTAKASPSANAANAASKARSKQHRGNAAMPSKEWYYVQDRQKVGPVSKEEIRSLFEQGTITGTDLVWSQGMSEWKPASQVQARFAAPAAAPAAAPPASPLESPLEPEGGGMDPAIDMEAPAPFGEPAAAATAEPARGYDVGEGLGIERKYAPTTEREFASFGARLGAFLIDGIIVFVLNMAAILAAALALAFVGSLFVNSSAANAIATLSSILIFGISIAIPWLYYARQESGMKMATIGKRAVGIQVIDTDGYPISFLRATGRWFSKSLISSAICGIGYFFPLFTQKKQALHDLIATTLVVKAQ